MKLNYCRTYKFDREQRDAIRKEFSAALEAGEGKLALYERFAATYRCSKMTIQRLVNGR